MADDNSQDKNNTSKLVAINDGIGMQDAVPSVSKELGNSHLAFIQVVVGAFLAIFFAMVNGKSLGLIDFIMLSLLALMISVVFTVAAFALFKIRRIREPALKAINWVVLSKR